MSIPLTELFDTERQGALQERLGRATDLQDVADAIHDELAGFAHVDGQYVKGLTKSELPVALAILALVRESNGQLVQSVPREPAINQQSTSGKLGGNATLTGSIVTVSATLGASAGFFLGAIGGIVGAALVGAGAAILFGSVSGRGGQDTPVANEPALKLDTQKVCDGLLRLFGKIDSLVRAFGDARADRAVERPVVTLANFPEFLRLFQLMWSAVVSDSKDEMLAIVQRQFPSLLRGQGLEVVRLSDGALHEEPADQLTTCDVDYSSEVTVPTLDYPPIRGKDAVLLKGRVLLPAPLDGNK